MRTDIWKVIGRGFNGWHAKASNCSSSGAYAENDCDVYAKEAADGCLVYDARALERTPHAAAFVKHTISGPMVNVDLDPQGVRRFNDSDREAAARMLPGPSGGFETIAAMAIVDKTYSGLDYVGVGIYEALLRKIPGIRFGRVQAGVIVWES